MKMLLARTTDYDKWRTSVTSKWKTRHYL